MKKPQIFQINMGKIPILNERPESMSIEDYRTHQKLYKQMLKLYRKIGINGKLVLPAETPESGGSVESQDNGSSGIPAGHPNELPGDESTSNG